MFHLPIGRGWLFSRMARRIYLGCAVLALALVATLIAVNLAMPMAGAASLNAPARLVVKVLLLPEILGTALLWIAMWYYWFSFDQSHYLKKFVFFLLLFFIAPFGTLLYYLVIYRRSMLNEQPASSLVPTP
jgi:hypothetical protein